MKYFIIILIILLAILLIGCDYLFRFACDSKFKPIGRKKRLNMGNKSAFDKLHEELKAEREILLARPHEEITSKSFDGLDLHADLFTCEKADRLVVCVHGYKGNGIKDRGVRQVAAFRGRVDLEPRRRRTGALPAQRVLVRHERIRPVALGQAS